MKLMAFFTHLESLDKESQQMMMVHFVKEVLSEVFKGVSARKISLKYFPDERETFVSYLKIEQRVSLAKLKKFVDNIPVDFGSYDIHFSNTDFTLNYIGSQPEHFFEYAYLDSSGKLKVEYLIINIDKSIKLLINRSHIVEYFGNCTSEVNSKGNQISYLQFSRRVKRTVESLNRSLVIVEGNILRKDVSFFKGVYASNALDSGRCYIIRKNNKLNMGSFDVDQYAQRDDLYRYLFNSSIRKEVDSNESLLSSALNDRSYSFGKYYGVAIEYMELDDVYIPCILILEMTIGSKGELTFLSPNTGKNIGYVDSFDSKRDTFNYLSASLPFLKSNTSLELLIKKEPKSHINGHFYTKNQNNSQSRSTTGKIILLRENNKNFQVRNQEIQLIHHENEQNLTQLNYLLNKYEMLAEFLIKQLSSNSEINNVKIQLPDSYLEDISRRVKRITLFDGKYLLVIDNHTFVDTGILKIENEGSSFKCIMMHKTEKITLVYSGSINNRKKNILDFIGDRLDVINNSKHSKSWERAFALVLLTPEYTEIDNSLLIRGSLIWQSYDEKLQSTSKIAIKKINSKDESIKYFNTKLEKKSTSYQKIRKFMEY